MLFQKNQKHITWWSIECFSRAENRMSLTGQITVSESPSEHTEDFTAEYILKLHSHYTMACNRHYQFSKNSMYEITIIVPLFFQWNFSSLCLYSHFFFVHFFFSFILSVFKNPIKVAFNIVIPIFVVNTFVKS